MPHIHTKDGQYDFTVSLFVVRYNKNNQPLAMLIMHKKLGSLLMPGGHIELNETPWQSAAHELEEETGYKIDDLEILQPKLRLSVLPDAVVHPQPFISQSHRVVGEHFHTDLSYAFVANSLPVEAVAEGESTDIRWLTIDEVEALSDTQIVPNVREMYKYIFKELLNNDTWEKIPANVFVN